MCNLFLLLLIALLQSVKGRVAESFIARPSAEHADRKYTQSGAGHQKSPKDPCFRGLPDALSFIEPLNPSLKPNEIVLYSGGHSYERRTTGFGAISSEELKKLAAYHGYHLAFLDELDYDRQLLVNGIPFAPQWHKIFAFDSLRQRFPNARYYVWLDDDILSLFPESNMLNHYINMVEADMSIEMLIGDDIQTQVLNTGMYIVRNNEFIAELMQQIILMGLEDDGFLAKNHFHEQGSLKVLRVRLNLEAKIPIIQHRDGPYNFNTFHNIWGNYAWPLDAFVHHVCCTAQQKESIMKSRLRWAQSWRDQMPQNCTFPINVLQKFLSLETHFVGRRNVNAREYGISSQKHRQPVSRSFVGNGHYKFTLWLVKQTRELARGRPLGF